MLQHKQEERELKRYEGDIIKKQHHLRRTMVEYENSKGTQVYLKCLNAQEQSLIITQWPWRTFEPRLLSLH